MSVTAGRVSANCLQTMTELLFRQLFHQLSHLLPNPFHILFSLPCQRLSKSLNHVPPILQDGLPTQNCLQLTLGTHYLPASKGRAKESPLLATCSFSSFFSFSWLAVSMLIYFYSLFIFRCHCSHTYPYRVPLGILAKSV